METTPSAPLIDPVEVTIANRKGIEKTYIISEIPAFQSREIIAQYPVSAMPKLGDYVVNEAMCLKMMTYVEVVTPEGDRHRLKTVALINNHCDFMQLAKLEGLMFQHNWGFFLQGTLSGFSDAINQRAPQWISKISTALSGLLSQMEKRPSTN